MSIGINIRSQVLIIQYQPARVTDFRINIIFCQQPVARITAVDSATMIGDENLPRIRTLSGISRLSALLTVVADTCIATNHTAGLGHGTYGARLTRAAQQPDERPEKHGASKHR